MMSDEAAGAQPEYDLAFLAASVAYYGFLAFVPLLTAVVLVYALALTPSALAGEIQVVTRQFPGPVAELITGELRNIVAVNDGEKMLGTLLALAFALWGALQGADALIAALNRIGGTAETRGFFRRKIAALGVTIRMLLAAFAALAAVASVGFLGSLLAIRSAALLFAIDVGLWALLAVLVSWIFSILYRRAASRPLAAQASGVSRGAAFATVLWIIATFAFSLYVANFASYNVTYGALAGVVVFLLWLQIGAYLLLWGARYDRRRAVDGASTPA